MDPGGDGWVTGAEHRRRAERLAATLSAAIAVSTTPTRWQQDDRDGDGNMGVEGGVLLVKINKHR